MRLSIDFRFSIASWQIEDRGHHHAKLSASLLPRDVVLNNSHILKLQTLLFFKERKKKVRKKLVQHEFAGLPRQHVSRGKDTPLNVAESSSLLQLQTSVSHVRHLQEAYPGKNLLTSIYVQYHIEYCVLLC